MKVKKKQLTKQQQIETLDALYTAAGEVRGREATKRFLRDLLTESERIMLGRRILIARHLLEGDTYEDIEERLSVAPTTIRRIHKWLEDEMPGYEHAIKKLQEVQTNRKRNHAPHGSFAKAKQSYRLHFLLFPWPKEYRVPKQQEVRSRKKSSQKSSHS